MSPTPWIEEEETLLKTKLSDMVVHDQKAPTGRAVGVWFRFPEPELQEAHYPFVTIDLLNISEALDRAQRGGQVRPTVNGYRPPDMTAGPAPGKTFVSEWPVAMNLTYQLTTWSRFNSQDREIVRQIWAKFPGRYGSLGGNAAPYVRPFSAQLLSMVPGDRQDEFGKRQFRKIFTLQVFSELWVSDPKEVTEITTLGLDLAIDGNPSNWFSDINCYET